MAANQAGEVSSPWTAVRTLESSPSGLSNFTVEQRENGRALLLQWSEPLRTNGVIKVTSPNTKSRLLFSRYTEGPGCALGSQWEHSLRSQRDSAWWLFWALNHSAERSSSHVLGLVGTQPCLELFTEHLIRSSHQPYWVGTAEPPEIRETV